VTVVTVVQNAVSVLEATIRSVLGQSYAQLEYVVVDGASTDGTVEILRGYSDRIDAWVSEPDRGIADALNKGSRLATGDLLLFMSAGDSFVDDRSLADAVALIPAALDFRNTIFYGDALYVHASGTALLRTSHEDLREHSSLCHPSVLVGADVQAANPYDERLAVFMDYDVWLRCLGRYPFVKLPLTISTFTSGGVSGSDEAGARIQIERALVQLLNDRTTQDTRAILRVLTNLLTFRAKRDVRRLIGETAFLKLKRFAGRDTPSVWAPPPDGDRI